MSVRPDALAWLARYVGPVEGAVVTSRYYGAEESWTGTDAWWHEVPSLESLGTGDGYVYLLWQKPGSAGDFYCLRVPLSFLREHRHGLKDAPRGYRLHLSAESANRFQDERGPGKVRFARFLVDNGS